MINILALETPTKKAVVIEATTHEQVMTLEMLAAFYLCKGDLDDCIDLHKALSSDTPDLLKKALLNSSKCKDPHCIVCDECIALLTEGMKLRKHLKLPKEKV